MPMVPRMIARVCFGLLLTSAAVDASSVIVGSNRPLKTITTGIAAMVPLGEDLYVYVEEPTLQYSTPQDLSAQPNWNGHKVKVVGLKYAPEITIYSGDGAVYEFTGAYITLAYENITGPMGTEGRLVGAEPFFYLKDQRGSTRITIDKNAVPIEANWYQSNGNTSSLVASGNPTREKFTGKERDLDGAEGAASGINLDFFGARYYDPDLGIWTAPDPARQFLSGYATSGNSLNNLDPDGMREFAANEYGPLAQSDWRVGDWQSFQDASLYNLVNDRPFEYQTILQRADFYQWFGGKAQSMGHDIWWPIAASSVARQVDLMNFDPIGVFAAFGNAGNQAIFEDMFPKLRLLYNSPTPLTGMAASLWDRTMLAREQSKTVHPLYKMQGQGTISVLQIGAQLMNGFSGDIMSPKDRWQYGVDVMERMRANAHGY